MEQQTLWDNLITFNLVTKEVKKAIAKAVQASGLGREQAMDKVNNLARAYGVTMIKGNGAEVSAETWEKWLNPTDTTRIPGIKALTVICAAFDTMEPMRPMAELAGGQVIDKRQAKLLAWAEAYWLAKGARQEMKKLEEGI